MNAQTVLKIHRIMRARRKTRTNDTLKATLKGIYHYTCVDLAWKDTDTHTCYLNDKILVCETCLYSVKNTNKLLRRKS